MFSRMIARIGHSPKTALSGEEGIAVLNGNRPDLILLDILMPDMDGWETLEHIRKDAGTRTIPVVMVSAKQLTQEEAARFGSSIDGYAMKPLTLEALRNVIDRVFYRYAVIDANACKAADAGVDDETIGRYRKFALRAAVERELQKILLNPPDSPDEFGKDERSLNEILDIFRERGVDLLPVE